MNGNTAAGLMGQLEAIVFAGGLGVATTFETLRAIFSRQHDEFRPAIPVTSERVYWSMSRGFSPCLAWVEM
jgi:hypothetical protein